ncbi:MAG TPA: hypothetical protein VIJ76_07975, partial [Galbitalea sp.]
SIDLGPAADSETIRTAKEPEFHADGLVFGYGYTTEALQQTPTLADYIPHVAPGNRLPHTRVDGRALFDLLGRELSVLGSTEDVAPLVRAAAARGVPLTHVDRNGPVVVVRPDQHIGWTGIIDNDSFAILDSVVRGFGSATDQ